MSFSIFTNIMTMLFCTAVLIQSVRLMRCLRTVKSDDFGAMIIALDASTIQARTVLADLRETLRVDCAANARVIATGTEMREELTIMAGIADAVAERIVDAVGKASPNVVAKAKTRSQAQPSSKPRSRPKVPQTPRSSKQTETRKLTESAV